MPIVGEMVMIMSGLFIMVAPFFFLPFMIKKFGGGNLDKIAGNFASKAGKFAQPATRFASKKGYESMGRTWKGMKAGSISSRGRTGSLGARLGERAAGAGRSFDQRQARNKMESEHYDEVTRDQLLERLGSDPEFRNAAAGGDATAANRLERRVEREVRDRKRKDSDDILRTLSRDDVKAVAKTGMHNGVYDDVMHEAAISRIAPTLDAGEAAEIAESINPAVKDEDGKLIPGASHSQAVRDAAVSAVAGKAPWFGGTDVGEVEAGTYNKSKRIDKALASGKITAEWLAGAKDKDIADVIAQVRATSDPEIQQQYHGMLVDEVKKLRSSPQLKVKVASGGGVDQQLNLIHPTDQQPTSSNDQDS